MCFPGLGTTVPGKNVDSCEKKVRESKARKKGVKERK